MEVVALPEFLARPEARCLGRNALADYIGANPEAGKVIRGLKGVRKVRWGRANVGKRGGVRVIYLYVTVRSTVYLLTVYAKAQQAGLTPAQKKTILRTIAILKGEAKE
jgi:hypothetical protein